MTQRNPSRRSVLKAGAGAAALTALGAPSLAQSDTRLRMFWWGSRERAERTDKTNTLFQEKNPGRDDHGRDARLVRLLAAARDADGRPQRAGRDPDGLSLHL